MSICAWCAEDKPDVRHQFVGYGVRDWVCTECYRKWVQAEKKEMLQNNVKHLQDENKKLKELLSRVCIEVEFWNDIELHDQIKEVISET